MIDLYVDNTLIGQLMKVFEKDEYKDMAVGSFVIGCRDDCIRLLREFHAERRKVNLVIDYKDRTEHLIDAICISLRISSGKTVEADFAFCSVVKEVIM